MTVLPIPYFPITIIQLFNNVSNRKQGDLLYHNEQRIVVFFGNTNMKCLSVRQPWADLIVSGRRGVEIRGRNLSYRGPLLIHASLRVDDEECRWLSVYPSEVGAILGQVTLSSVRSISKREWERLRPIHLGSGPRPYGDKTFGWFLENPKRFSKPIPYKGALNLFNVRDQLLPKRTYAILKPNGVIQSTKAGTFAGHRPGKIFGRLDCKTGMRMLKGNRVFFHSYADAVACGYRPCKLCKPQP